MSSTPTDTPKTIVADPEGDVLLLLESTEIGHVNKTKILCSSKHLGLASAVFRAMLRPNVYNEGTTLSHIGKVEIPLPEDDAEIMTTLVLLIHGRHQHPDCRPMVTFDVLGHAAILVDKYQMHEATNFRTAEWAHSYFRGNPIISHRLDDLPLLLCITWVFDMGNEFRDTTRHIQYKTVGSVVDSVASFYVDLPIPHSVIQKLDNVRRAYIRRVCNIIRVTITTREDNIDSAHRFCRAIDRSETPEDAYEVQRHRRRCDKVVLDSLISSASEKGLWPLDVAQSLADTSSVFRVAEKTTRLDFTSECDRLICLHTDHPAITFEVASVRKIRNEIEVGVRQIMGRLVGLDLEWEKRRFVVPMLETYR
ncbi:uncharacterized protein EAF01_001964 [Botrytis porri]|uniref:BTB domain-containing protein n=1 Tax=Botrytis porri TaxID=87229 RepID=A0A4Z1KB85_9HELO|nr:uncharacterized protein EAF01_001964 [Botrytis porri]KAF7912943.1 hypothetical protein EAF01_001964 [Botrytis porri]TGO81430.1 hypothetical protein BPOR_1157g00010 [Botrytis porri]